MNRNVLIKAACVLSAVLVALVWLRAGVTAVKGDALLYNKATQNAGTELDFRVCPNQLFTHE